MSRTTKREIAEALANTAGNISAAARKMGVSRSTLHRRIAKSKALNRVVADQRESLCDDAESCIASAVRSGDVKTAQWYLIFSEAGRKRGYGKQPDTSFSDNANPVPTVVEIVVENHEQVGRIMAFNEFEEAKAKAN